MNNDLDNANSFGPVFYNKVLEIVPKNSIILEFGSGLGTIALRENYQVISVEHDATFAKDDPYIIYAPIKNGWYDVGIIKDRLVYKYDAMIIDGPPGGIRTGIRLGILKNLNLFNLDVPIFVDDTHRIAEKLLFRVLAEEKHGELFESTFNRMFGVILPENWG